MIYSVTSANITKLFKEWIQNDNLVKLLADKSNKPFDFDLSNYDRFELFSNENLIKKPKLTFPETEQKSYISVYIERTKKAGRNNTFQYDVNLFIDIVCHIDTWDIEDSNGNQLTRPYEILDIVENLVRNTTVDSFRGKLLIDEPSRLYIPNDRFMGYRMVCCFTNTSVGCDLT